jgi:hypothetical protein
MAGKGAEGECSKAKRRPLSWKDESTQTGFSWELDHEWEGRCMIRGTIQFHLKEDNVTFEVFKRFVRQRSGMESVKPFSDYELQQSSWVNFSCQERNYFDFIVKSDWSFTAIYLGSPNGAQEDFALLEEQLEISMRESARRNHY